MKWERGKGGKKEAYSQDSKVRYVYSENTLSARLPTGAWITVSLPKDFEVAKLEANAFEVEVLEKEARHLVELQFAKDKAKDREELRALYKEVILDGGLHNLYTNYKVLRENHVSDGMIEAVMTTLSPVERNYLVRTFALFHKEGFK